MPKFAKYNEYIRSMRGGKYYSIEVIPPMILRVYQYWRSFIVVILI